jgi:hypothetical protein
MLVENGLIGQKLTHPTLEISLLARIRDLSIERLQLPAHLVRRVSKRIGLFQQVLRIIRGLRTRERGQGGRWQCSTDALLLGPKGAHCSHKVAPIVAPFGYFPIVSYASNFLGQCVQEQPIAPLKVAFLRGDRSREVGELVREFLRSSQQIL